MNACSQSAVGVQIRVQDNVNAQHQLVTEKFGITSLVAVLGWSMGAGQTFQWAVRSAQTSLGMSALVFASRPLWLSHSRACDMRVQASAEPASCEVVARWSWQLADRPACCSCAHGAQSMLRALCLPAATQRWCRRSCPSVAQRAPALTTGLAHFAHASSSLRCCTSEQRFVMDRIHLPDSVVK